MSRVRAWAAPAAGQALVPFEFDAGPLGPDEVEVAVEYCGLCHSDVSAIKNERYNPPYPVVAGHEIVGRIVAVGEEVRSREVGQRVGIGWTARSCLHCPPCIAGDQNLCRDAVRTIIGHYGGFAERVRVQWLWAFALSETLDAASAGPLLCGGITVFSSLLVNNVNPADHIGVLGIGGLGHLAVKFAKAWGCEITVFTHSASKADDSRKFGADYVVTNLGGDAIKALSNKLDFLLVTSTTTVDWPTLLSTLKPKGRLHIVGFTANSFIAAPSELIGGSRSVSGSSTGTPTTMAKMLEFAARHGITPEVEHFPMTKVNEAISYLEAGKPRYRLVLDADFANVQS
jgi:uncharacterized zinc-type alcohol dehydrogenase-like protein